MTFEQSLSSQSDTNRPAINRILLLLTLCIFLGLFASTFQAVSLHFYSPLIYESSHNQTIQSCPHVVLFSSARHGTTWFIDSVDNCRYSTSASENKPFSEAVYLMTEPWKHETSSYAKMSGTELADHVRQNSSVKILPSILFRFRPRVEQLLESAGLSMDIPVVILRRDLKTAFLSHQLAMKTNGWNTKRSSKKVIKIDSEHKKVFQEYRARLKAYFEDIQNLIAEKNVTRVDIVDYDDIKDVEYIKLKNSECYIKNCNFRNAALRIK